MFLSLIPNNADRVTMTLTSLTKETLPHDSVLSHNDFVLKRKNYSFYDGAVKTLGCAFLL